MGIGVVVRDHDGSVMACLSAMKQFLSKPIVASYWALKRAMHFGEEWGMEKVDLEGDAQVLVQAIN